MATKLDDWRFEFLTGKIWLLSVINCEDNSLWCLPQNWFISIKIVKQKIFTWFLGKLSTKSAFSMVHLCCFQEVSTLVFVQTSWWFSHVFRKKMTSFSVKLTRQVFQNLLSRIYRKTIQLTNLVERPEAPFVCSAYCWIWIFVFCSAFKRGQLLMHNERINGGYHGVKASQSSHIRSLSSHLIFTFLHFFKLSIFTSSFFSPTISSILHFFTLKNKTSFSSHLKTQIFSLPKRQVPPLHQQKTTTNNNKSFDMWKKFSPSFCR